MSARRGSQTMERLPRARGPHSMRPWNQPTTSPSAIALAVSAAERGLVVETPPCSLRPQSPASPSQRRADLESSNIAGPSRRGPWRRTRSPPSSAPHEQRRPDCSPRIPGRRLHVYLPERRSPMDLAIGDRIHRAPSRQRKGVETVAAVQCVKQMEEGLFVHGLYGAGDIAMSLRQAARLRCRACGRGALRADANTACRPSVPRPPIRNRSSPWCDESTRDRAGTCRRPVAGRFVASVP